jgi:8-oxo-dGTP diphosphatase
MAKKGEYIYDWPRPMVTVDALVFSKSQNKTNVLLIQRGNPPFKSCWAIPGGFVEMDEELENAAQRELKEETGLDNVKLHQLRTFGKPGRDPRGRQITIVFTGIIENGDKNVQGGDDAEKAEWFNINNLPENLAFDHSEVIEYAVKALKRRDIR